MQARGIHMKIKEHTDQENKRTHR